MLLKDKKVLVTGASRGIGKAIAIQSAKDGADVIVHYNSSIEDANDVIQIIRKMGRKANKVSGNLGSTKDAKKIVQDAWQIFVGIDILVNNAGIIFRKHFLDFSEDEFNRLWQVNVRGTFFVTQEFAKLMITNNKKGKILTITSVEALRPGVNRSIYASTKSSLETMMKAIALELSPYNILVNTLAPGATKTDINKKLWENPETLEKREKGIALGHFATPEEIAKVACLIISSRAEYVTGSTILVDGGLSLLRSDLRPYHYGGNLS